MFRRCFIASCCAGIALCGSFLPFRVCHAQVTFTDQASFLDASGSTAEAEIPASGNSTTQVVGGMTFTAHAPSTFSWNFAGTGSGIIPGRDLAISGDEEFNIDFAAPITSLGFEWVDVADAQDTSFDVTFLTGGAGGTVVDVINFAGSENLLNFQGFVASQPFDRIEVREVGDDGANELFGQFYTGALAKAWTNVGSGNWDTGTNWTGSAVPAASDFVVISPSTAVTVTGPAGTSTVAQLTIDNQGGFETALNLQSSGALTVTGDTNVGVGGRLQLQAGTTYNPTVATNLNGGTLSVETISQLSGSPAFNWNRGTLEVTGAGGLAVANNAQLGPNPITIDAGKTLDVTGDIQVNSPAIVTVDGGTVSGASLTPFLGTVNVSSGDVNLTGAFTNTGTTNITGGQITANSFDTSAVALASYSGGEIVVDGGAFTPFAGLADFTLQGTSNPTLTLNNGGNATFAGVLNVSPNANQDGTLNINSGSTVSNTDANVGSISFVSDAIVNVDGAGSTWNVDGILDLGHGNVTNQNANRGRDQLNVSNGAEVNVTGIVEINTTGRVNLDGGQITAGGWVRRADSIFDHTGGTLTIDGGDFGSGSSSFTLNGTNRPEIVLTNGATHTGVQVDVNNAVWTVETGSQVSTTDLDIFNTGPGGPAQVVVDGMNSQWNLTGTGVGTLDVGLSTSGDGELTVSGGGAVVSAGDFRVAASPASTSTVTVQGTDSKLLVQGEVDSYIGGSVALGIGATGLMEVTAGGEFAVADDLFIGSVSGANGTLKVMGAGSSVTIGETTGNNDFLVVGNNGVGALEVRDGGTLRAEQLFVSNDTTGVGNVIIDSANTPGANVTITGIADIGDANNGSMTISNRGTLTTSSSGNIRGSIGFGSASDGSSVVIDGAGSKWTHMGTADFSVAHSGGSTGAANEVTLDITGGGALDVAGRILIADSTGSRGVVTVSGDDGNGNASRIDAGTDLFVGDQSNGFLNVEAGGVVEAARDFQIGGFANGDGVVTVTGAGSQLISRRHTALGDSSATAMAIGLVEVGNGGVVQTDSEAQIGSLAMGSGTANINAGGTWNANSMYVGGTSASNGGAGTVNVNTGGLLDVETELKLWDNGSVNLNGGTIEVGTLDLSDPSEPAQQNFNFVSGTFRFANGASLSAETLGDLLGPGVPTLSSGQHLEVVNTATIDGDLRLNGGTLSIGFTTKTSMDRVDFDSGTLNITGNGFTVTSGGLFGTSLVIDEDQAVNTTQMNVNADGILNITRGAFSANIVFNFGTIVVAEGTADFLSTGLVNNGDLVLVDATTSGTINNNGHIEIVNSVASGTLNVQAGGSLGMDVEGLSDFDTLAVDGNLLLSGTLDLDINSALTLTAGDSFELIDISGELTGEFANFGDGDLVGTFDGRDLFIDYDYDNDIVALITDLGFAADTEPDGDVDGADFLALQRSNAGLIPTWQTEYGNVASLAATQSVPEPATFGLLLLSAATLSCLRRSILQD